MSVGGDRANPSISICIVTGRRTRALDACLASLQVQREPPSFEVLVGADRDPGVAEVVRRRFPEARVRIVDGSLPGAARNLIVDHARGDLLLFLDDDVTAESDLLARLADLARAHPEAGVFGGPNDTPIESSRFQIVQGAVLASAVGAGPVRRRYGAHPSGYADERFFILCNLAVRRDVMVPFEHDLVCAEENALLSVMSRSGVAMYYDPELVVYHERRPTLAGFIQQMHKYGRGRGQLLVRRPFTLRPAFLAPTALLAYAGVSPVLVALVGPWALAPLAAYLAAVTASAVWIGRTLRRWREVPLAALLLVALHGAYGSGVVRGLRERRPAEEPLTTATPAEEVPQPRRTAAAAPLDEVSTSASP